MGLYLPRIFMPRWPEGLALLPSARTPSRDHFPSRPFPALSGERLALFLVQKGWVLWLSLCGA